MNLVGKVKTNVIITEVEAFLLCRQIVDSRGGDLGGTGGTVPPKIWGGGRRKLEERAFCCEERVIYDIWYNKDTENLKRESQNQKNLVND